MDKGEGERGVTGSDIPKDVGNVQVVGEEQNTPGRTILARQPGNNGHRGIS